MSAYMCSFETKCSPFATHLQLHLIRWLWALASYSITPSLLKCHEVRTKQRHDVSAWCPREHTHTHHYSNSGAIERNDTREKNELECFLLLLPFNGKDPDGSFRHMAIRAAAAVNANRKKGIASVTLTHTHTLRSKVTLDISLFLPSSTWN